MKTKRTPTATKGWTAETIIGTTKDRYLDSLEGMVAMGRKRNDPTLAIAVSVEMLALLVERVRRLNAFAQWAAQLDDPDNPEHETATLAWIANRAQQATQEVLDLVG